MPWMDEELARQLAAAVLSLPHDGKVSQAIGIVGFTIPLDYEPVEALMRELRLPPFDKAPEITWRDVLATYLNHFLILLALTLALSLGTALVLFRMNRRLTQDKVQISQMVDQLRANEGELESLVGNLRSETKERKAFAEALTRTTAELTRLGVVMAHHFQEPVRRMAGFAQHLLNKSALATDADSRQSLEFIDQQARRLSELVRDVQRNLALDHAEVGASETADSGAALHQSIAAAGMAASDADISLLEPLPTVHMTEKRLRELFAILLDNALRYRHSERPLRIEVSATVTGDRAVFRFADNGSGIAPEYRAQVFELFTRLVPNSVPGTGMGLALVRKIIKQAGGNVCVEDGLDGGACIVFDLPVESNL
jgi:signal transduction histidine kinase